MIAALLRLLVGLYRVSLGLAIGGRCRFYPSCSQYALDALQAHGAARGSWLTAGRVLRCHPWHPGGYDPAPGDLREGSS